ESPDFPGIGSADSTLAGAADGFVAKLSPDLSSILAATFLGGSSVDSVNAIAFDSTGNLYVAGSTDSPDFPGVGPGSADSTLVGTDGFVAKLNSDLSSILAATFVKGGRPEVAFDEASALALDSTGNLYVTGRTTPPDFPGPGSFVGTDVSRSFVGTDV